MDPKERICGCGDHTHNDDGVCDTCRFCDVEVIPEKLRCPKCGRKLNFALGKGYVLCECVTKPM